MPSPEATRWKVNSEFPLYWRSWGDEFVIYNSGSGDTHLLDPVAAEALQNLEQESADLSELVVRVATSLEIEPDTDFASYLEQLLSDLYKLGLIERIQQ